MEGRKALQVSRNVDEDFTMNRKTCPPPTAKNYLAPNINRPEVETPYGRSKVQTQDLGSKPDFMQQKSVIDGVSFLFL